MKIRNIILSILFVFALLIGVFYFIFFVPKGVSINKIHYKVKGIDVSQHTGNVDFQAAKNEGFSFAYVKATEGENFVDPYFKKNLAKLTYMNDFYFGFYHFYKFNKCGIEQAKFFIRTVKGSNYTLPLVVDFEEWGQLKLNNVSEIIKNLKCFITYVEKNSIGNVVIYTNESTYNKYIKGRFKNKIWICSFDESISKRINFTFWQFSHKGKFKWAEGNVDLNVSAADIILHKN